MTIEPLDKGTVKHFLDFVTNGEGRKEIAEPVGFDGANLVLEQDDKRYGRDISFSGGQLKYKFYNETFQNGLTHEFNLIQEDIRKYGFENEVKYILQIDGSDYVLGEIDFETATTDQIEFFEFTILQENEQAIIKRRIDVEVDLFSDKDLDDNTITPISTEVLLLEAKPLQQFTRYRLPKDITITNGVAPGTRFANGYNALTKGEIQVSNAVPRNFAFTTLQIEEMFLVQANTGITDISVDFDNISLKFYVPQGTPLSAVNLNAVVEIGLVQDSNNRRVEYDLKPDLQYQGVEIVNLTGITGPADTYTVLFNRTLGGELIATALEKIWVYFDISYTASPAALEFRQSEGQLTIQATSLGINSVTRSIRLIDAMRQVCKSIGGFNVTAPRFEQGGQFYNQRLFDGNLLRGFEDKPFYLSLEEILEAIEEFNGDYEITSNGEIFFGIYEDFYRDVEIARFTQRPNSNFSKYFNLRYLINKFVLKYKTFEEDRDEKETLQSVHTNTQWFLPSKRVENEKVVENPFIRDPLLLESTRIRSIEVEENKALKEDNKKFIVESVNVGSGETYNKVLLLTHSFEDNGDLKLINDGSFSWIRGGLQATSAFEFILTSVNVGSYRIIRVQDTLLTIRRNGALTFPFEGLFSTAFTYTIRVAQSKNRTNEGFVNITGLINTEGFGNLNYTPKRNLLNFWGQYLNTAASYIRSKEIKNTFYKNNRELSTQKPGESVAVKEGDSVPVTSLRNRILTPFLYDTEVQANFSQVNSLITRLRSERGYVTIVDNRGEEVKVHPSKLDFQWNENLLMLTAEERYQIIDFLTITTTSNIIKIEQVGYPDIVLNEMVVNIDGENVLIYDAEMLLLTRPIKYTNISVNGVIGSTIVETKNLLQNISNL